MKDKKIKDIWVGLNEKNKQNIKGAGVLLAGLAIMLSLVTILAPKNQENLLQAKRDNEERGKYKLPENISSIEDKWLVDSRQEIEDLQRANKQKESKLLQLNDKIQAIQLKLDSYIEGDDTEILRNKLEELENNQNKYSEKIRKEHNQETQYLAKHSDPKVRTQNLNDPFARGGKTGNSNYQPVLESKNIVVVNFTDEKEVKSHNLDSYLPAGSYARAILISAVDASVGLNSQSNPRQALFRIVSDAKSALDNNNKPLTSNINGCVVTGAASGDLSSERAYVRLLKMTCQVDGQVVETNIEGYAADGSDGKAGIAGKVVSREGDLVTKSFLAGIVSGIGSGLAAKYKEGLTYSDSFSSVNEMTNKQIAGQGIGEGIENSSNTVADYLIKRAEQYQPVVSISSGKEVELVFMSGTYLDGRIIKTEADNSKNKKNNRLK